MIKLKSLILENHEVVDLRDPNWIPGEYDKKEELSRTMISIWNGKIYLYRWGNGNKSEWKDVVSVTGPHNNMMLLTGKGNLVLPNRIGGDSKWEGARNIYSPGTKEWVKILMDAGIINDNAKIYIGNWASQKGMYIGKAKYVITKDLTKLPAKLSFYHGTSSDRIETIQREGLKPVPLELRPWKSEVLKNHPEYREHAVYLTFDIGQADYYARKAVKVARRHSIYGSKKAILKVTIPRSHYKRLLPDDDYLMRQLIMIGVTWIDSLKNFSQVAYLGAIPPEWISIESVEPMGWREDPKIKEGLTRRNFDAEIEKLSQEWDRVDHMGGQELYQQEISNKIAKLQREKEKWEKLYLQTLNESGDNIDKIKKLIHPEDRIIMAKRDILPLHFPVEQRDRPDQKPRGLWYAIGTEWIDWVEHEMPEWMGSNFYKIEIDESKILFLKSSYDMMKFTLNYSPTPEKMSGFSIDISKMALFDKMYIDWELVAKQYSGIEISPYRYQDRHRYMWYYGWDVASGCIWNKDAIIRVHKISI